MIKSWSVCGRDSYLSSSYMHWVKAKLVMRNRIFLGQGDRSSEILQNGPAELMMAHFL